MQAASTIAGLADEERLEPIWTMFASKAFSPDMLLRKRIKPEQITAVQAFKDKAGRITPKPFCVAS